MSNNMRQSPPRRGSDDCPPIENPADQPNAPGCECDPLPTSTAPPLADPPPCDPDPCCECPTPPSTSPNCLEKLIADQATQIMTGTKSQKFKEDLEKLAAKAAEAKGEYTSDKHKDLVSEWRRQDREIAELIRKLVCAVPCWRCVIECYVSPLLNELRYAEQRLYGDGTLYPDVKNLYDLRYWHQRDFDAKTRRFKRIESVLTVWANKPASKIDTVLKDNDKLRIVCCEKLCSESSKVVYDTFLKLVPTHLAIAPPKESGWTTTIGKEFTEFSHCDVGKEDDCCGPDVGEWTLRQRLIGPLPYLVDPGDYLKVVCCLVENRYHPAQEAAVESEAALKGVDDAITRNLNLLKDGLAALEKDAKAAIPTDIDCCGLESHGSDPQPARSRC